MVRVGACGLVTTKPSMRWPSLLARSWDRRAVFMEMRDVEPREQRILAAVMGDGTLFSASACRGRAEGTEEGRLCGCTLATPLAPR